MTIPAGQDLRADYDGNGSTVTFTVPFRFLQNSDLKVLRTVKSTGVETELTLDSIGYDGFSVSGAGQPNGGSVTVVTAPAGAPAQEKISILLNPSFDQLIDYIANDPFPAETHERGLDKVTMLSRALKEQMARALTFPESQSGASTTLPAPSALAPLVWSSDGLSLQNGDPLGTGDMLLRGDLASTASGKGGGLIGFIQSSVGAIARTLLAKSREVASPEDFGAIGDGTDRPVSQWLAGGALDRGYASLAAIQVDYSHVSALTDSIDWAGFQAAINACQITGKRLRASGNYMMNRGLTQTLPIRFDGGGWGQSGAVTGPAYTAGCRITATSAANTVMWYVAPAANPGALHGVMIENLILDANNLAQKCLMAESCTRSTFRNIDTARCTSVAFDFTDGKGYYFYKNRLDALRYNATANAAAASSAGVWFRDTTAAAGGIVQNHVGWIECVTVNGDCVVIGGADNNEFGAITCNTSAGTGVGVRFKGPTGFGTLQPRNNFLRYVAGSVVDETNTRTNQILKLSSESNSITLTGSGGETKFSTFNYVTGQEWRTPAYTMKDVRQFSVGDLRNINGTESTFASIWPSIDLADGATQGFGLAVGMDYDWHSGTLKSLTVYLGMSTSFSGNVRLRVRGMTPAVGDATTAPTLDESFTVTPNTTAFRFTKHTLTFTTPLAITKGDMALFRVDRVGADAADTHTGVCQILGSAVHYTATGPSVDGGGGGPWQVLDPTI
jgi:hypothetical protein